jgi:16S rRNA processing protein RimM
VLWDDLAVVGRVVRPHGLRGQVVVNVETDFPDERFKVGAQLFVRREGRVEPVTVASVRFQRGRPIIGVTGVATVESAEALVGSELRVPVGELVPLPAGNFYRHDLVGCVVEVGEGKPVGVVVEVEGDSAGSRLVVEANGEPVLIPLAAEICRSIDLAAKRIVIDPPDGLLELNRRP